MPGGPAQGDDHLVDVWRVALDLGADAAQPLRSHLDRTETARLRRLGSSEIAHRWMVSRAALREILAAELGVEPSQVRLLLGDHGRPRLDPGAHDAVLDFNLSHSADLALVAVTRGPRVGVDVERLREGRNPLRVADRYFSPAEVAALRALPERDRPRAFLRYWTAKEALAKGLGLGLQAPKGELELAQRPGGSMDPVRLAGDWRLVELADLPDGYSGAVAVEDTEARVSMRDWAPRQAHARGGPAGPG